MTLRRVVRARRAFSGASTECAPRPAASCIFVAPKPLASVVLYEDGTDFACLPVAAVWSPIAPTHRGLVALHVGSQVRMDAITMLKDDHEAVEQLFGRFDAKVTVLINNVRHHIEEEEGEFFPMVRDELGRNALSGLGEAMAVARKIAPTHPPPPAPHTPPRNLVVGSAARVAHRIRDTLSGLAQGGVTAIGDIIATVLRRKKPRVSPTGSKVARSTATQVRSGTSDGTEAAIEATRKAKRASDRAARTARATGSSAKTGAERTVRAATRSGTSTARAAKAGVKGTATSVRTSTKRTATTAKRGATTTGRTARKAATSTTKTARRAARETASTAAGSSR